jgi:hypothetical protein
VYNEELTPMATTTHTSPDDPTWRSTLAKAAARKSLAEADFLTTVAAMTERVPQTQIAAALHTSQANVSRWAARGREQAQRRRAGRLGADPYEIAQRYALGEISRDAMLEALTSWAYEEPSEIPPGPLGAWEDGVALLPDGSFERTVQRAFDDGLLDSEEYETILRALAD